MADPAAIHLTFEDKDVAVLTLDDPRGSANVLSRSLLEELEKHLDALENRSDLAGLVIRSGKPGVFIVGADIREFLANIDAPKDAIVEMCAHGRKLFARLSKMPFVTVTAYHGQCVGGGAEMALWCDRRVVAGDSKAMFGFPEVKLGLFPGWGGTVRCPASLGLGNAVELITSGESIDAHTAALMGLVTDVVSSDKLLHAAIAVIRAEQNVGRLDTPTAKRWSKPLDISDTELGFLGATASAYIQQQTKGQVPGPAGGPGSDARRGRRSTPTRPARSRPRALADLFGSPVNRALINVFFLTDRNKKDTGRRIARTSSRKPIKSVGVFGAGIMGQGIACGRRSSATCPSRSPTPSRRRWPAACRRCWKRCRTTARPRRPRRRSKMVQIRRPAERRPRSTASSPLRSGDRSDRRKPGGQDSSFTPGIEPQLADDAILASNTSAIPITRWPRGSSSPSGSAAFTSSIRFGKMPLVEVIRGAKTSDETDRHGRGLCQEHRQVADRRQRRARLPGQSAAAALHERGTGLISDGVEIKAIERAAKAFGMPMGPITLYDVVGLDTAFYAGRVMHEAFPDRIVGFADLGALVKAGRLGQKTGVGFFAYQGQEADAARPIRRWPTRSSPLHVRKQDKFTSEQIMAPAVPADGARSHADFGSQRWCATPRDVDLGLIFGIGFPPFKGGLLFWADTLGAAKIVEMLKPHESLGPRAEATPDAQGHGQIRQEVLRPIALGATRVELP